MREIDGVLFNYLIAWFDQPQSGLSGQMGGHNGISLPSSDFGLSVAYDDSVSDNSNETINMCAHVNFDHVSILHNHIRFTVQG